MLAAASLVSLSLGTTIIGARSSEARDENEPIAQVEAPDEWEFRLTPYLWIPGQDGTVAIGGVTAPVDLSVGDTFDLVTDYFNFAASARFEARSEHAALFFDGMYLDLEADGVPIGGGEQATLRQSQGIFELGGAWTAVDGPRDAGSVGFTLEPLAGVRVYTLRLELDSTVGAAYAGDRAWIDGFVGARARFEFNEWLGAHVRADIGAGGSDLCWNIEAGVDLRVCEWGLLHAGYRALSVDYSTGSGGGRFEYDMTLQGPYLAFTFEF